MMGGIMGLLSNPTAMTEQFEQFGNMAKKVVDALEDIQNKQNTIIEQNDEILNRLIDMRKGTDND